MMLRWYRDACIEKKWTLLYYSAATRNLDLRARFGMDSLTRHYGYIIMDGGGVEFSVF